MADQKDKHSGGTKRTGEPPKERHPGPKKEPKNESKQPDEPAMDEREMARRQAKPHAARETMNEADR